MAAATAAALPADLFAGPHPIEAAEILPLSQQTPEPPKLSEESRAEVEAKVSAIFRKYGSRLSAEQKTDVRRLVTEAQKSLESLRAFPLDNADEPATPLKLYPEPGSRPRTARARHPGGAPSKKR